MKAIYCFKRLDTVLESPNLIFCQCLNVSTTPLCQWGFRQCLPFSWTTLKPQRTTNAPLGNRQLSHRHLFSKRGVHRTLWL